MGFRDVVHIYQPGHSACHTWNFNEYGCKSFYVMMPPMRLQLSSHNYRRLWPGLFHALHGRTSLQVRQKLLVEASTAFLQRYAMSEHTDTSSHKPICQ